MFILNLLKKKDINNNNNNNTKKFNEYKVQKEFTDNECIICLDEMNIGDDIIVVYCGHKYHKKCLFDWFQRKKNCPICDFCLE